MRSLIVMLTVVGGGLAVAIPSTSQAAPAASSAKPAPSAKPATTEKEKDPSKETTEKEKDPSKEACVKAYKPCTDKSKSDGEFKSCADTFAKCFDTMHGSEKDDEKLRKNCKAHGKNKVNALIKYCLRQFDNVRLGKGGEKCTEKTNESVFVAKTICHKKFGDDPTTLALPKDGDKK